MAQPGRFAHLLPPPEPTLADLIDSYTLARARWTPETDDAPCDIADAIKVRLMADCGLSAAHIKELGGIL
jgi:hypothetical protein